MRRFIAFLIFLSVVVVGLLYFYPTIKRYFAVQIDDVSYFSFSYTTGLIKDTTVLYKVECNDEGKECTATVKRRGIAEEDAYKTLVDSNFMRKIRNVLVDHNVGKWNNFYKTNSHRLDGDSFTMDIKMINGETIQAHGYMKWPNNYGIVKDEFDKIFKDLLD